MFVTSQPDSYKHNKKVAMKAKFLKINSFILDSSRVRSIKFNLNFSFFERNLDF